NYKCLLAVLRLNTCLQYLDNDGAKGTVTNDLRRRLEERALEKEEEDYFNEDSDDEDSTSTSISHNQKEQQQQRVLSNGATASQKEQQQRVLSNGAAASHSDLSPRSGGLVDYDDDEDDEDYKPPPRKQPETSEEDEGVMESLGMKRKLPLKEKEMDLVHKQKMSKSSKSKDVFAALCSTLSHAVLPGNKTAIKDHT
ncbi:serine/threonine protein phosphatase 4 regulatory subunit, partial [Trifolium medium]|nr:serine/threonine protein phosphatase 4 regulatory subunit [Trifolium medium]